jgi:hypothetical protein
MPVNQAAKKKRGRPSKKLDMAKVIELVKKGKKDQEIADELGVSVRKLRSFRKENGILPAVRHGGARPGAGRKRRVGGVLAYMKRQQAVDSLVNSIDAGIRVGRFSIYDSHLLKWASSAFKFDWDRKQYVGIEQGLGLPAAIRQRSFK